MLAKSFAELRELFRGERVAGGPRHGRSEWPEAQLPVARLDYEWLSLVTGVCASGHSDLVCLSPRRLPAPSQSASRAIGTPQPLQRDPSAKTPATSAA